eukprot:scaffold107660_cov20-Tisochrysis_lutea.AAC.3
MQFAGKFKLVTVGQRHVHMLGRDYGINKVREALLLMLVGQDLCAHARAGLWNQEGQGSAVPNARMPKHLTCAVCVQSGLGLVKGAVSMPDLPFARPRNAWKGCSFLPGAHVSTQVLVPGGLAVAESGKYMLQLNKEQAQAFAGKAAGVSRPHSLIATPTLFQRCPTPCAMFSCIKTRDGSFKVLPPCRSCPGCLEPGISMPSLFPAATDPAAMAILDVSSHPYPRPCTHLSI